MGERIEYSDGRWVVPSHPIIPFIEGDGTGPDIWRAARRVFDATVRKVSGGKRQIDWLEVLAGERSEAHTSELQSRFDLVCRLLLEKKKPPPGDSLACCPFLIRCAFAKPHPGSGGHGHQSRNIRLEGCPPPGPERESSRRRPGNGVV